MEIVISKSAQEQYDKRNKPERQPIFLGVFICSPKGGQPVYTKPMVFSGNTPAQILKPHTIWNVLVDMGYKREKDAPELIFHAVYIKSYHQDSFEYRNV